MRPRPCSQQACATGEELKCAQHKPPEEAKPVQVLSPYPNYLAIYLSMYPHLPLVIYLSIHLSIHSSVYLSMSIYLCLSIYVYLSMSIYLCLSIYLPPITPHYLHVAPPARTSSRRVATWPGSSAHCTARPFGGTHCFVEQLAGAAAAGGSAGGAVDRGGGRRGE